MISMDDKEEKKSTKPKHHQTQTKGSGVGWGKVQEEGSLSERRVGRREPLAGPHLDVLGWNPDHSTLSSKWTVRVFLGVLANEHGFPHSFTEEHLSLWRESTFSHWL